MIKNQSYFSVEISLLRPDQLLTIPLYVHLRANEDLVLRYREDQAPTQEELSQYASKGLKHFVCPEIYREKWQAYLKAAAQPLQPATATASNVIPLTKPKNATGKQAAVAGGDNVGNDKREALIAVGKKMIKTLTTLSNADQEEKERVFQECRIVSQDIIEVAMQTHKAKSLYQDLMLLAEDGMEHSTNVSTLGVIFALVIGLIKNDDLTDIALAGLLHDLGHCSLNPGLLKKSLETYTPAERKTFEQHTESSYILLADIEEVSPALRDMLLFHHEQFDGQGFPKGLKGGELDECIQVVHLADKIDDLMCGRVTGQAMNPLQAFQWIKDKASATPAQMIVSNEIFMPIFEEMMNSQGQLIGA